MIRLRHLITLAICCVCLGAAIYLQFWSTGR